MNYPAFHAGYLLTLPATAPALVFWLTVLGVQTTDQQLIDVVAHDGSLLLHQIMPIDHNMAQYRGFVGLKRHNGQWVTGNYSVSYQLLRQQQTQPILNKQFSLRVF